MGGKRRRGGVGLTQSLPHTTRTLTRTSPPHLYPHTPTQLQPWTDATSSQPYTSLPPQPRTHTTLSHSYTPSPPHTNTQKPPLSATLHYITIPTSAQHSTHYTPRPLHLNYLFHSAYPVLEYTSQCSWKSCLH